MLLSSANDVIVLIVSAAAAMLTSPTAAARREHQQQRHLAGHVMTVQTHSSSWARPLFSLYPFSIERLVVNTHVALNINCSIDVVGDVTPPSQPPTRKSSPAANHRTSSSRKPGHVAASDNRARNMTVRMELRTLDDDIATPVPDDTWLLSEPNRTDLVTWETRGLPLMTSVWIRGNLVGKTQLLISVSAYDGGDVVRSNDTAQFVVMLEYHVTVVRRQRLVNYCFDVTVAVVVLFNAFGLGCTTKAEHFVEHAKKPTPILLAAACQLLIMPIVALGMCKVLLDEGPQTVGFFLTVCSPGGGIGLLLVIVTGGDQSVSRVINAVNVVFPLGASFLWMLALSKVVDPTGLLPLLSLALCLVTHVCFYVLGIVLRHYKDVAADAVLNWLTLPLLLLTGILFTTLGSYINMYVFSVVQWRHVAAACGLPTCSFLIGLLMCRGVRLSHRLTQTVVMETTISNCMLVIAVLRFCVADPDDDLAVAMPFWVLFTTPVPLITVYFFAKMKRCVTKKCAKRKEKKYRHFSIVSSLVNVTNMSTLSASVSTKLNSPIEEDAAERITAL